MLPMQILGNLFDLKCKTTLFEVLHAAKSPTAKVQVLRRRVLPVSVIRILLQEVPCLIYFASVLVSDQLFDTVLPLATH